MILSASAGVVVEARLVQVIAPSTLEVETLKTKERMKFSPRGVVLPQVTEGCEKAKSLRVQALLQATLKDAKKVEIDSVQGTGPVRDAHVYIDDLPVGRFLVSRKLASTSAVKEWCK